MSFPLPSSVSATPSLHSEEEKCYQQRCETKQVGINGGSWISFAIGYVLGLMDASPSVDHTKYGGAYLETVNGRSTIM